MCPIVGLLTRNSARDFTASDENRRLVSAFVTSSVACKNSISSLSSVAVEAEKLKECMTIETFSEFLSDYQQQSLSKEEICKLIQVTYREI